MLEEIKKEFTPLKLLIFLLTVAVSIYLIQSLSQIIGNFSDIILVVIIAWLLSFILTPIVNLLVSFFKISKTIAALIVYIGLGLLIALMTFIFIPVISSQLKILSEIVPQYFNNYPQIVNFWDNAIKNSIDTFISYIPSFANILVDIVLILFLSFYLVIDKEKINQEIYKFTPKNWHKNIQFVQQVIDDTFSSFLQIQLIFGIISGIITWIVLSIFGINFAPSVGFISGLLTLIPLAGPIFALIPPVFIALATNPGSPTIAIAIFLILLLIQQIIFNYIGPKLMGKAFKLHPIIVFLSIIIGFKIAGAFGAIFIVPILGILVIVVKKLGAHYVSPDNFS